MTCPLNTVHTRLKLLNRWSWSNPKNTVCLRTTTGQWFRNRICTNGERTDSVRRKRKRVNFRLANVFNYLLFNKYVHFNTLHRSNKTFIYFATNWTLFSTSSADKLDNLYDCSFPFSESTFHEMQQSFWFETATYIKFESMININNLNEFVCHHLPNLAHKQGSTWEHSLIKIGNEGFAVLIFT